MQTLIQTTEGGEAVNIGNVGFIGYPIAEDQLPLRTYNFNFRENTTDIQENFNFGGFNMEPHRRCLSDRGKVINVFVDPKTVAKAGTFTVIDGEPVYSNFSFKVKKKRKPLINPIVTSFVKVLYGDANGDGNPVAYRVYKQNTRTNKEVNFCNVIKRYYKNTDKDGERVTLQMIGYKVGIFEPYKSPKYDGIINETVFY